MPIHLLREQGGLHALSSPSSLSPGRPKGSWKHRRAAAPTGPAVKAGLVLTVPGREGTGPCSSEPRCHRELRCRTTSPVVGQQSTSETPAVNCFNGTRACQGKRFLAPFPFLTQRHHEQPELDLVSSYVVTAAQQRHLQAGKKRTTTVTLRLPFQER